MKRAGFGPNYSEMGKHKPFYIQCRNCGSELDFQTPTTRRQHSHNRSGYCNKDCKTAHGGCGAICCADIATEGVFCWRHKLSEAIRQNQGQILKAKKWCAENQCSFGDLPKELPFNTGWPDDPVLCREFKTKGDYLRWEQIIRFSWVKQYFQREVKIVVIDSFRKGVQGESVTLSNWPQYINYLISIYKALPRFRPQTLESPTVEESKNRLSFKIDPRYVPTVENYSNIKFTTACT